MILGSPRSHPHPAPLQGSRHGTQFVSECDTNSALFLLLSKHQPLKQAGGGKQAEKEVQTEHLKSCVPRSRIQYLQVPGCLPLQYAEPTEESESSVSTGLIPFGMMSRDLTVQNPQTLPLLKRQPERLTQQQTQRLRSPDRSIPWPGLSAALCSAAGF